MALKQRHKTRCFLMMTNNKNVELNIDRDMAYPSKSKTTVFENSDLDFSELLRVSFMPGLQFKCKDRFGKFVNLFKEMAGGLVICILDIV